MKKTDGENDRTKEKKNRQSSERQDRKGAVIRITRRRKRHLEQTARKTSTNTIKGDWRLAWRSEKEKISNPFVEGWVEEGLEGHDCKRGKGGTSKSLRQCQRIGTPLLTLSWRSIRTLDQ